MTAPVFIPLGVAIAALRDRYLGVEGMVKLTKSLVGAVVLGAVAIIAGTGGPAMAAEGKAAIEMRV